MTETVVLEPFVVGLDEAARLCDVSRSKWCSMKSAGLVPFPVYLGRRVVWPVDDLKAWLQAGAPSGLKWQQMKIAA